ncbi:MarR family winged helix-turn-helix transcriptional regulator [Nocardia arthritidis]|uniref:MarR family transcriptional regulator n=1 Tax=Nocardia arthritidis TaxID=228602 RepID=A0A6G9Y540_9NOCA|nr:MarR family transcriptional regulator [Nocardia arthritidis]QIS08348.1 MarR family transcriptional regulator [Nocardia arthritidis]
MDAVDESLETIALQLSRLHRIRERTAAQMAALTRDGVDLAAFGLLFHLACHGPMRSGALAAALHSDASTVSRQVAQLVARELVVRQADPEDGRATVLVVTEEGHATVELMRKRRAENMGRVMADWPPRQRAEFAALLRQFVDDYERKKPDLLAAMRTAWGAETTGTEKVS